MKGKGPYLSVSIQYTIHCITVYYSPVTHRTSKPVGYVIEALIIFLMFVRVLSRHTKSSNIYTQN